MEEKVMSGACRTQGPAEKAFRKAIDQSDKGIEVGKLKRLFTKAITEAVAMERTRKTKEEFGLKDDGK
jgi:hypothetical protein